MSAHQTPPPALRSRARRPMLALALLVALLGSALAVHLVVTGLQARRHLQRAHAEAAAVQQRLAAGETDDLAERVDQLLLETARARALTSGPVWRVAGAVPVIGRTPRSIHGIAKAVDELARAGHPLAVAADGLVTPTPGAGTAVDLDALAEAAPALQVAQLRAETTRAAVAELPDELVPAPIGRARQELLAELDDTLLPALRAAAAAAPVAPGMLGAHEPRRYFVALQNTAEARGTGGLPGAYAVVVLDGGRLRLERVGSDRDLVDPTGVPPRSGAEHTRRYASYAAGSAWLNANLGPHFPDAGRIWAQLWERQAGQRIDGVLALDPAVLDHVLAATGPVVLANGTRVAAGDGVPLTLEHAYVAFPDQAERKSFLVGLVPTVLHHALTTADPSALARSAVAAAQEGRLRIWSRDPSEQRVLEGTRVGGVLPVTSRPYALAVVNNAFGNKLDYYLDRRVDYHLGACGGGQRASRIGVRLANRAPDGLGDYVTGRVEDARRERTYPYAYHRVLLSVFGTQGAHLRGVRVDGVATPVRASRERGHVVVDLYVDLPRGKERQVVVDLVEPLSGEPPLLDRQPLVRPQSGGVTAQACG